MAEANELAPKDGATAPAMLEPALVVNLDRCTGCWACAIACKMKNNLRPGVWWVRIDTIGGTAPDVSSGVFPDLDKGYQPSFERCVFTKAQAEAGRFPDCMTACPMDVFTFGDMSQPDSRVARQIAAGGTTAGGTPTGGAFSVHYLASRRPRPRRNGYSRLPGPDKSDTPGQS